MPYEKVGKSEPVCIADEVPFEIPESWEWVRLSSLVSKEIRRGKSPKYSVSAGIQVFAQKCNVKNGGIDMTLAKYLDPIALKKYPVEEYLQDQDIIVNSTGNGTLGRIGVFRDANRIDESVIVPDSHVTVIRLLPSTNKNYLLNVLRYYQPYLEKSGEGSTNQTELKPAVIANLFVPLPPQEEQIRIVDKLVKVFPLVEKYGNQENALVDLNSKFPDQLKKSILQEAVQGKLVPQDPNDEPASVLLERIHAEKERLIKEGKIKRDKHESVIFKRDNSHYEKRGLEEVCIDKDIPFDIPDGWCWCRFSNICYKLTDGSHNPPPKKSKGFRVISARNIKNGKILFTDEDRLCDQVGFDKENPRTQISKGDIILGIIGGSIGNTAIYEHDAPVIAQRSIAIFGALINNQYMKMLLDSPLFQQQFTSKSNGTAQGGIYLGELANMLVPLPPANEQNRILTSMSILEKQLASM